MFKFQKIDFNLLSSLLVVFSLSATITIIPDFFFLFSFNYIGYTIIPLFFLILLFFYYKKNQIILSKHNIKYYLIFIIIYSIAIFSAFSSGQKSFFSSLAYFTSFTIFIFFSESTFFKKNIKLILNLYLFFAFLTSLFVFITFILLSNNLTSIESWYIINPLNEKFELKFEKLGSNSFSFIFYLSLIMTKSSKTLLELNLTDYGDFTGLSYESSLSLLYCSVAFLYFLKDKKFKNLIWLIIFIVHVLLGFSLTNIIALTVVLFFNLFVRSNFISKFFLISTIFILSFYYSNLILEISFFDYKINSRSYEDSTSSILSLFSGGFLGEGVFSQNYKPGIITSFLIILYYFYIIKIIVFSIKLKKINISSSLIYMLIHSFKFPLIFIQLPFAFWIPLMFNYILNRNK